MTARLPEEPGRLGLGVGLDLPWGAPIGFSYDPARGDAVTERVLRDLVGVMADAGDNGVPGRTGPRSRSLLAAPLVAFDEVLGAIYLESDLPDQAFDEGHLSLLMSIAAVAGTALGYERHAEWLAS